MKRWCLLLLVSCSAAQAHCAFLGFKPFDAVAGREAGYLLATAAYQGWYLGGETAYSRKPGGDALARDVDLSANTLLIYMATPEMAGLEPNLFYRRTLVDECGERMFVSSLAIAYSMFGTGPGLPSQGTLLSSAIAAAATAGSCSNMEAGEYFDLNPLPIAY